MMRERETYRSDSKLHRSEYQFWRNSSCYHMETAYSRTREGIEIKTTAYYKPGQYFMYEKKFDDYTMYRSRQGLIDVEIKDIIDGYGDYNDFYKYDKFMSDEERQKAFQGLDEEDKEIILKGEIKNILNGIGDYRDFHKVYKEYMCKEDKNKCLEAFEKYY